MNVFRVIYPPPYSHLPILFHFSPLILFTTAFYLASLKLFSPWLFTNVLTSMRIPNGLHTSEDSKLASTNERKHPGSALTSLRIALPSPIYHPFTCEFHNSLFLNIWVIFHCVNKPYFQNPLISWWVSRCFHFLAIVNSTSVNMDDEQMSL